MKKSYVISIIMAVMLVLWMASGLLTPRETSVSEANEVEKEQLMLVQTEIQKAQTVQLSLTVQGQVEPNRSVMVRSDIEGRIKDILVDEGKWVDAGTTLVRLAIEDRQIKLDREKALLDSRKKAFSRAQALSHENYQSKSVFEETYAALKAAEANVAHIQFEINKLNIKAPFSGVLDSRMVEQGGYVSANGEIGRFVENSSLIVVVQVAQQNIQQVRVGAEATVVFATGETRQGKVKHISMLAKESTRTFRVEVLVANSDRSIPAGISAEVEIPTTEIEGHFVSPAVLGLDDKGEMGIKTVDENNVVAFYPVSIMKAATAGVWVKGLPDAARIITIGQGFVEAGTKVKVEQVARDDSQEAVQ